QRYWPSIHVSELLEQHHLAFHHRHRGLRTNISQTKHSGTIRNDSNSVAFNRQLPSTAVVFSNRLADPGHTWRISLGKISMVADINLRGGFYLAALMHMKGPIRQTQHCKAICGGFNSLLHLVAMLLPGGITGQVDNVA